MPVLNGLDAAWKIVESGSRAKILMLTVHDSDAMIRKVLAVGIRGYVFKTDAAADLVNAVKDVQNGNMFFTPRVGEVLLDGFINHRARIA
jgi:DNA-binding NarL/FixJ family response regulator